MKIQHKKTVNISDAQLESVIVNLAFGLDSDFDDDSWIETQVAKVTDQCEKAAKILKLLKQSSMKVADKCEGLYNSYITQSPQPTLIYSIQTKPVNMLPADALAAGRLTSSLTCVTQSED